MVARVSKASRGFAQRKQPVAAGAIEYEYRDAEYEYERVSLAASERSN